MNQSSKPKQKLKENIKSNKFCYCNVRRAIEKSPILRHQRSKEDQKQQLNTYPRQEYFPWSLRAAPLSKQDHSYLLFFIAFHTTVPFIVLLLLSKGNIKKQCKLLLSPLRVKNSNKYPYHNSWKSNNNKKSNKAKKQRRATTNLTFDKNISLGV